MEETPRHVLIFQERGDPFEFFEENRDDFTRKEECLFIYLNPVVSYNTRPHMVKDLVEIMRVRGASFFISEYIRNLDIMGSSVFRRDRIEILREIVSSLKDGEIDSITEHHLSSLKKMFTPSPIITINMRSTRDEVEDVLKERLEKLGLDSEYYEFSFDPELTTIVIDNHSISDPFTTTEAGREKCRKIHRDMSLDTLIVYRLKDRTEKFEEIIIKKIGEELDEWFASPMRIMLMKEERENVRQRASEYFSRESNWL
jgi:hypothetical protein